MARQYVRFAELSGALRSSVRLGLVIRGSGGRGRYLVREDVGAQVLEGQLELLRLAAEDDLDDNGRVERDGHHGRHDGQ